MDKAEQIVKLKAEIFDLQLHYGKMRSEMEKKLKELNALNGNEESQIIKP